MKVLHLFSDWKWTGPAEPVLSLCETLTAEGVDVTIAYRKTPIDFPERTVGKEVKARGLKLFEGFKLNRYFSPRDWLFDMGAVKSYALKENIDIIHTNLGHDHFTALLSIALSRKKPLIVRTDHKRDGTPYSYFMGWAFGKTDGLVAYGKRIMSHDMKTFHFPEERTCVIPPAIRAYEGPVRNLKGEFGIKAEEKVIGVIGRLKPDRGYDLILKGFRELRERMNGVKLLVVGRSSQIEKSIIGPISELGIQDDVILAGYRIDDYFSIISTFDLFVMMRAGSDGSARALREVMAMGKAAVVSDSGMLPELVRDNVSGFVVKQDPHELADRMERVLRDETQRCIFEKNAKKIAAEEWNYPAQARRLKDFYERLLVMGRRPPPERRLRG
ncbi:MAG: glycosyl transferase group 1 [Deltaproteobacteria bacterium]|jgi:glycosyltransferase involved in cell wall biosynthesis|nr:glycosyl transferase group 1 [Deltaproteobacteria bacterium]